MNRKGKGNYREIDLKLNIFLQMMMIIFIRCKLLL